jgi:hypothetical protein
MTSPSSPAIDIAYLDGTDWWSRVEIGTDDECWPWKLSTGSHGYGQTWDGTTVLLAHRVAWMFAIGPIPEGMTVDHICRTRRRAVPA